MPDAPDGIRSNTSATVHQHLTLESFTKCDPYLRSWDGHESPADADRAIGAGYEQRASDPGDREGAGAGEIEGEGGEIKHSDRLLSFRQRARKAPLGTFGSCKCVTALPGRRDALWS